MIDNSRRMTVYKNEMNTIPLRQFTSVEMDLFFSICTQMRDKGVSKVRYSFTELKELSHYKPTSTNRFVNDLDKTYSKMIAINYRVGDSRNYKRFVLFTGFEVNSDDGYVEISTNPELQSYINAITGNFTKFELEEFLNIKSSYSKTAFRLLKQFRLTGYWKIKTDDFRELFDIPESYPMTEITRRVFKPIQDELLPIFKNLQINKVKAKKGNRIEYLEFRFKAEDDMNSRNEKTFRDKEGNYYQKDLFHLTQEEENKTFPSTQPK